MSRCGERNAVATTNEIEYRRRWVQRCAACLCWQQVAFGVGHQYAPAVVQGGMRQWGGRACQGATDARAAQVPAVPRGGHGAACAVGERFQFWEGSRRAVRNSDVMLSGESAR